MRKVICRTILPVLLAASVAGCQKPDTQPTAQYAGKTITVVTTYGPNDGGRAAFEGLCNEFSQNTGVNITDNSSDSTEEWKQSVINSYNTGNEPDVLFYFTGNDAEMLIDGGKFVSLEDIRAVYPDYASNINLSVMESLKASDGKGYAVPVKGYWERLLINTDIFDELRLPPPHSYDEMLAYAPILLQAGYVPLAASLNEVPHYLFEALLFNQTGPSEHHHIPDDPDDLPQSWITALSELKRMYEAGMFPEDTDTITHAEAFELFQAKKAAMIIDGDWSTPQLRDTENTAVINFPVGEGPRRSTDLISGFSMGFYISASAWNDPDKREAAVAFVEFITSDASILRLNVSGAAMPITVQGETASDVTPLRKSIDELNLTTTAFVGAVGDRMKPEARALLFGKLIDLAKGELDEKTLLAEFVKANTGN